MLDVDLLVFYVATKSIELLMGFEFGSQLPGG
jgi:hypothetical protein